MTLKENITKARSHILFCAGLCVAASMALSLETGIAASLRGGGSSLIETSDIQTALASKTNLSATDLDYAKTAWAYFETNFQPETGLVNSVQNFASTTIWDQASYLLALISAERIGLIDQITFNARMGKAMETLAVLPLFDGKLPNKVYDTRTLAMTDYSNTPNPRGIGWSALDVARVTVPLNILLYDYPQHAGAAGKLLNVWDFSAMIDNGQLFGARVNTDGQTYVVSEPYILTAIEFGFDKDSKELAHRLYLAQQERYSTTGVLTAVSEDNIDQEPYFLYNTVFANGTPWNALAEDGSQHPDKRTVSTKAAFGWDAIYDTDYTDLLMEHVLKTKTDKNGFASGVYEADGRVNAVATANTNAIILETLQYKANGPLLTARFLGKGRS